MYAMSDIVDAIRNPRKIVRELNLLYHRRLRTLDHYPDGVDVVEEDWDNLILLDACRYDAFVERSTLPGKTEYRESKGTHSREFVRANFAGKDLHDTVVVTANGWYEKVDGLDLHDLIYVSGEDWEEVSGGRATPPASVSRRAREAADRYPEKRMIVHYMQPHRPFIGELGRELYTPEPLTEHIRSGEVDIDGDRLWDAYLVNLDVVLDEAEGLLTDLEGKTVVSADHGELVGDPQHPIPIKTWGHVHGVYVEERTKVPWHVHQNGDRRTIRAEASSDAVDRDVDEDQIDERLEQLGYLQ